MESRKLLKNGKPRGKLTKKDITKMSVLSFLEQASFSFERMQAPGFTLSMLPAAEKIFGDSKEDMAEFMTYNMEFINTEPHMATFLMGLILSMEEHGEDRKLIEGIRNGLFGPFAGLGDAIFWFTVLPISAAICCSLAQDGSILGPLLYIGIWIVAAISRIWFGSFGYKLGVKAVSTISEGTTVQSVFDGILPNMLPLAIVFLIYWLFKKKNAKVLVIILGIILFGILMSFLGWM